MQDEKRAHSQESLEENKKRVVLHALAMAFGTFTSRVLGLVRDMAFAALFSRTVTDAWTTAFRLPNLFRRLLGEGSLSVSFVPVFVDSRIKSPQQSHEIAHVMFTMILVFLSVLTALGIIFAEDILKLLLDPSYHNIPGKFELTVRMAKIMFGFIFLMSIYAYFMSILNALGRFGWPAMAPTFFNIAMIISTFVPVSNLSSEGDAIAWGVIVGGILQAGVLLPQLGKLGYWPKISFRWNNPPVLSVLKNMLPGMLGMGLLQITTIVNLRFASHLGEGPISYIFWADRLLELPLSLISVSLGTALLPTLSQMWSQKNKSAMLDTTNHYFRLNLFIALPAALGLYVLAVPIIELLFQRGRFGSNDTMATASIVQVYSLLLFSSSSVRVLVPSFYAIKNTWLPALVSAVSLVSHILMAPWLMARWGIIGLVSSSFLSATLNMVLLLIFYKIFLGPFGYYSLLKSLLKFVLAGGAMYLALQIYEPLQLSLRIGWWGSTATLFITIIFSAFVYFGAAYLLKTEEFSQSFSTIINKIKNKLGRNGRVK